jgi:hypothetical protein
MSEAYRRLNSQLPARRAPGAGAFASDVRSLRAWSAGLPMANSEAAARRVLDGLRQLNRQRLQGAQRLEALEVLRGPLTQLAVSVEKQVVGASFPLSPHKAELGELALEFQGELASGYRAALAELCAPAGAIPFLRGKQVALAALRALQHGGEHLAKAYLLYRTPPAGAWLALHAAYGFVASLRLDDRLVAAAPDTGLDARTAYIHALLFALLNPYRYTQREQVEIGALVRALAPACGLREARRDVREVAFHTDGDRGPGYLPEESESGERNALALHLDAALALVEDALAHAGDRRAASLRLRGGTALAVDADLLRRAAAGLRSRGTRAHARLGGGYAMETVLGLHDLHFMLAGGEDFESFMHRVRGQAISLSETDRGAMWRTRPRAPGHALRLRARVLDQGLGGYRLLWERGSGGDSVHARVAELVGLALPGVSAEARAEWMIGVVRWLRIDDEGRVDAGIELLARHALPVGARDGEARTALRGLLLAALDADAGDGYAALVVPTEIERSPGALELSMPADLHGPPAPARIEQVDGLRLLEANGIFRHFALPTSTADADAADAPADEALTTGTYD